MHLACQDASDYATLHKRLSDECMLQYVLMSFVIVLSDCKKLRDYANNICLLILYDQTNLKKRQFIYFLKKSFKIVKRM